MPSVCVCFHQYLVLYVGRHHYTRRTLWTLEILDVFILKLFCSLRWWWRYPGQPNSTIITWEYLISPFAEGKKKKEQKGLVSLNSFPGVKWGCNYHWQHLQLTHFHLRCKPRGGCNHSISTSDPAITFKPLKLDKQRPGLLWMSRTIYPPPSTKSRIHIDH